MANRTPIIGGNWKMHTDLESGMRIASEVIDYVDSISSEDAPAGADVVLYPPFPYLQAIESITGPSHVQCGAQDLWIEEEGAFTGEVSASMLKDVGASMVLTGHSERRHIVGESDELVGQKTKRALDSGLAVTLCVGETINERNAGNTLDVVCNQLSKGLDGISADAMANVVIAYEPVWAIGTGHTASPEDAQEVHVAIRAHVESVHGSDVSNNICIQYGGSVKPENAKDLFACPDIDGALVGGASLTADSFNAIIEASL
ncbi:MAG: triose-phosphate isomerase [Phycisphaerales bacterium]|nr:triose-phosphate isomerase [Phycisphaerales bacterium]